jgi:hypothetical protein
MSERGWTFIEATMGVILTSILVLGLAVTILAMRDTIDRSFTIRVMDQYGSDIMRHFQIYFETAVDVHKIASQSSGTMDHFDIVYRDPFTSELSSARYRATRTLGVLKDGQRVDQQFPPMRVPRGETGMLHPGETFTVTQFTITNEITSGNMSTFSDGVWRVTLGLRYTKLGGRGESDFYKDMTYSTLLVAKNSYLDPPDMY